jgi:spermidine dehydrogenase
MTSKITRRDFMNGVAVAVVASAGGDLSAIALNDESPVPAAVDGYPPGRAGLRGSHVGSFEAAHRLRDGAPFDLSAAVIGERYDLVVVGAGISGLAAAYFYQQRRPQARVLILDTNDDFGGHAKRNEFAVDGKVIIGYGGTQSIDSPRHKWSKTAKNVLHDLGIDVSRFETQFDQGFYSHWDLARGIFFKKESFGTDRLVRRPFGSVAELDPVPRAGSQLRDFIDAFPLSAAARAQLLEMYQSDRDVLAGKTKAERRAILEHTSYRDFLKQYWNADEDLLKFLQSRTHDLWAIGIDALPASETLELPGLAAQRRALGAEAEEPYIYHFPDGNASIARMLVRRLIPSTAPGSTMDDIVLAHFDYGQLDRPEHAVRIRLNSTAVDVRNVAEGVEVAYVTGGKAARVKAADCVLACYQAMIPYIAPETDAEQRAALHENVRAPLVYVTLVARNWRAWHKLGLAYIDNPGGTYAASLDFPVSMDGYRFSTDPSQPICIHLIHTPTAPNQGLTMRQQYRAGRMRLYAMSFADFENEIRDELGRMLANTGFDFDRDIAAITVNRWPHGYAYTPTPLFDEPVHQAHIAAQARRRIGRIAIANSDSGWDAYTHIAIDQAHRAVHELTAQERASSVSPARAGGMRPNFPS